MPIEYETEYEYSPIDQNSQQQENSKFYWILMGQLDVQQDPNQRPVPHESLQRQNAPRDELFKRRQPSDESYGYPPRPLRPEPLDESYGRQNIDDSFDRRTTYDYPYEYERSRSS